MVYETKLDESLSSFLFNETQIGPEIIHEYKVINKGPSEISKSELLITWQNQIEFDDKHFDYIYLMETPYLDSDAIKCNIEQKHINPLNVSVYSVFFFNFFKL